MKKNIALLMGGFIASLIAMGYLLPERLVIPVKNARTTDWNHATFWYEPWGASGVHKGIDIFAAKGTPALAATDGIVLFAGVLKRGGKALLILGPKWRLHYFAHLDAISAQAGRFVTSAEAVGLVGDSGNAKGKPAHLHYSVVTLIPYPWRWDATTQGWKKVA